MFSRLSGLEELPEGYRVNKPLLSGISNAESRQPGKAPTHCANWMVSDPQLEVVNTTTGKTDSGQPSRLCKASLYSHFKGIYGRLSALNDLGANPPRSYEEAKQLAGGFHAAKKVMMKGFEKSGHGTWIEKPLEQDMFE